MDEIDRFSQQFEASRPRLRALAFRMLGSQEEADDAVQETWLRIERADTDAIDNFGGWLTTVVGRICLDRLRSRRARPEDLTGIGPPEHSVEPNEPEDEVVMADSVGSALLLVLDHLAPAERVAFVLHDVFAVPFDEVGEIVGRSPDAARQLASRARRRIQGATSTRDTDLVRRRELVQAFLAAARGGDFEALLTILDPDVAIVPDATAQTRGRIRPMRGTDAIAEFIERGGAQLAHLALVDGVAGLAWMPGGRVQGAMDFTIEDDRIVEIRFIGDPDHLEELDVLVLED